MIKEITNYMISIITFLIWKRIFYQKTFKKPHKLASRIVEQELLCFFLIIVTIGGRSIS